MYFGFWFCLVSFGCIYGISSFGIFPSIFFFAPNAGVGNFMQRCAFQWNKEASTTKRNEKKEYFENCASFIYHQAYLDPKFRFPVSDFLGLLMVVGCSYVSFLFYHILYLKFLNGFLVAYSEIRKTVRIPNICINKRERERNLFIWWVFWNFRLLFRLSFVYFSHFNYIQCESCALA